MRTPKIGLLASNPAGWHAQDLLRAAPLSGVELLPLDFRQLRGMVGDEGRGPGIFSGGEELGSLDALLVRSMPAGSLEQVVFRMDALHRLQASGVAVVNPPAAIEAAVDKFLALARITAGGLPAPRTRVAESADLALQDFHALGGNTVVKPLFGSGGRGIFRVENAELAGTAFRALERLGAVIYQQEFVPHPEGDLRVLVIGGEACLAMRRSPGRPAPRLAGGPAEWRANVTLGGLAAPHVPSAEEAHLAARAAALVGAEIAGVDLIPASDGRLLVSEVNSAPGWRALARVSGADPAALILGHVRRRAGR